MIIGIIYLVTNKVNQKVYIGKTMGTVKKRWSEHCKLAKQNTEDSKFQRALRKYKPEGFEISILYSFQADTKKELNKVLSIEEKKAISDFDSFKHGYNSTLGGEGILGKKMTKEEKEIISKATKNAMLKSGASEKISKKAKEQYANGRQGSFKGRHLSEEAKKKISDKNKGKPSPFKDKKQTEEAKQKMRASWNYDKHFTEKTIQKMRENNKGINNPNFGNHKLAGANNPSARRVLNIDTGKEFSTMKAAGEFYGLKGYCNISSVCTGKLKTYAGYHWKYVE